MRCSNLAPKRIFMLSSQTLFSQGVESLLRGQLGVEIVGRETDTSKAVESIRKLKPNVVVIDGKDLASAPFSAVACLLKEQDIRIIAMNLENETIRVFRGEQRNAVTVDDLVAAIKEDGEELKRNLQSK